MHFNNSPIIQVIAILRLASRMEIILDNFLLGALPILMALRVQKLMTLRALMESAGYRKSRIIWNVQLQSLPEGLFLVLAFCSIPRMNWTSSLLWMEFSWVNY
jgi:hypothetical protein